MLICLSLRCGSDYQLGNAATALALLNAVKCRLPVERGSQARPAQCNLAPRVFRCSRGLRWRFWMWDIIRMRLVCVPTSKQWACIPAVAVFGMMQDKDIAGVVEQLVDAVDLLACCGAQTATGGGSRATGGRLFELYLPLLSCSAAIRWHKRGMSPARKPGKMIESSPLVPSIRLPKSWLRRNVEK